MTEVIAGILLLLGSLFSFIAALGVLRLPDVLIRMHASTKAGTLGCSLIALGAALYLGGDAWARAVLIILFLFLTAPMAAHMLGRAALRTGVPLYQTWKGEEHASEALNEVDPENRDREVL